MFGIPPRGPLRLPQGRLRYIRSGQVRHFDECGVLLTGKSEIELWRMLEQLPPLRPLDQYGSIHLDLDAAFAMVPLTARQSGWFWLLAPDDPLDTRGTREW